MLVLLPLPHWPQVLVIDAQAIRPGRASDGGVVMAQPGQIQSRYRRRLLTAVTDAVFRFQIKGGALG